MGSLLDHRRVALSVAVAMACLWPNPAGAEDDVVARLAASVNANDRAGFVALFDESYSYNGERREDVLQYLFVTEGGRKGNRQSLKVLEAKEEQRGAGRRVGMTFDNCYFFAPKDGELENVRTVCGGGSSVIDVSALGKITAYRPVTDYKAVGGSVPPAIDDIRVNGRQVRPGFFEDDIRVRAGDRLKIRFRISGDIVRVSLLLGNVLESTQMRRSPDDRGVFEAQLAVPRDAPAGRYFIFFKPYTSDYHIEGKGSIRVVTLPVEIISPARRNS